MAPRNRISGAAIYVILILCFLSGLNLDNASAQSKQQTIDLAVTVLSSSDVKLSWRINNPGVIGGIRIYRATPVNPELFNLIAVAPANTLTYIDSGLAPESSWIYKIHTQGRNPLQLSAPSNWVGVTTMSSVSAQAASQSSNSSDTLKITTANPTLGNDIQTLIAKAINWNQIELRWAVPNLPRIASLRVFRASSLEPRNFVQIGSIGAHLNTYLDSNLKPRTTYYYQLKYNQHGDGAILSPPSNTAFAMTLDNPAPDPRAVAVSRKPKAGIPFKLPSIGSGSALPYDELEEEMLRLLNQYRALKGLGPVRPSIALSQAADLLSSRLADAGVDSASVVSGGDVTVRARMFSFPNYLTTKFDTAIFLTSRGNNFDIFELLRNSLQGNSILTNPEWKVVGIARRQGKNGAGSYLVFDFANYWDKTVPLPGEDTDGRIDGNERVRTRPPYEALFVNAKFSGYGDDGNPYSPKHCDLETNECWKDPAPASNRSLKELSAPENMIGTWRAQYQVSSTGVWHFNDPDRFDATEFTMTLMINKDGTWVSQGYRAYQTPIPQEAGTWNLIHDASRGEEIVTFYRDNARPAATIRVHAAPNVMTFFAVDGGAEMKNFFKGVPADSNPKDDPQIIFVPGQAKFFTQAEPFPAALRCASCADFAGRL